MSGLTIRTATEADLPALRTLMALSIDRGQSAVLTPEQVVASRAVMGLDTQLVRDGTYFVVEERGVPVGCGGWSRRATLYGGDHSTDLRDPALLDPATDAARIRAMYTHPDHVRRGIGRMILDRCERTARAEGFAAVELMGTAGGRAALCGMRLRAGRTRRCASRWSYRAPDPHAQSLIRGMKRQHVSLPQGRIVLALSIAGQRQPVSRSAWRPARPACRRRTA